MNTHLPIITDQFFREGIWAHIHDRYDRSFTNVGSFPSDETAWEYCKAFNRNQVLEWWTRASREQIAESVFDTRYPGQYIFTRAFAKGYDADEFVEQLLLETLDLAKSTWQPLTRELALVLFSWSESEVNPDAVAEQYGAKHEYQWRNLQSEQRKDRIRCWCDDLGNDRIPSEIGEDEPYLDWLSSARHEMIAYCEGGTEWRKRKCDCCGSEVWQLFLEGRYNEWFWWYAVPSPSDILCRNDGTLNKETIEAWFEGRAGIYVFGEPRFYTSTKIQVI